MFESSHWLHGLVTQLEEYFPLKEEAVSSILTQPTSRYNSTGRIPDLYPGCYWFDSSYLLRGGNMILILKRAKIIVDAFDGLVKSRNLEINEIHLLQEIFKAFDYFSESNYPVLTEHMRRIDEQWMLLNGLTTRKELAK